MDSISSSAALPYHEPGIVTILILTSFLLFLNAVNHVFDKLLYCGLLGQIALGIAWGTPGGKWIGQDAEQFIVNLGYLGLLLLVYEGGLLTSFKSLKANLFLSSGVALTGVALPMGLSYVLMRLNNASPIQAFAAGAALCSTSLGTTFAIMSASGLITTRMGVVLTSAATMDDVVGLVMVQVISSLGASSSSFSSTTVIRPVFVSIAFAIVTPLVAQFIVRPLTLMLNKYRERNPTSLIDRGLTSRYSAVLVHTALLVAMITGSTYAGTSNLFAAYLSGAAVSWWDSEVSHVHQAGTTSSEASRRKYASERSRDAASNQARVRVSSGSTAPRHLSRTSISSSSTTQTESRGIKTSGSEVFEEFYAQPLARILKPFFFASIGFSIPISRMFSATIVWKGFVYAILMFVGKLACGLWLIRIPYFQRDQKATKSSSARQTTEAITSSRAATEHTEPPHAGRQSNQGRKLSTPTASHRNTHHNTDAAKPLSIYPGIIVGCAMVARGEIGFLISALAESNGIFGEEADSPIFLVVTWAIILCTVVGPILVGTLVKRVKRLQSEAKRGRAGAEKDVLGVWGVE